MPKPRRYVTAPLPWWSKKIQQMRTKLDCNQTTFAKKLGCSSMSVSRWERGLLKPPPAYLIALGEMAGPPVGLQFWKMAGINPNSVKRMLSATQKGRKQDPKRS